MITFLTSSLSMVVSRFIFVAAKWHYFVPFSLLWLSNILLYLCITSLPIHLAMGVWGSSAVVNSAAMNIGTSIFL